MLIYSSSQLPVAFLGGFFIYILIRGVRNMYNNFLRKVTIGHFFFGILGFIPRIHSKHSPLDPRNKSEDDNRKGVCAKSEDDNNAVKSIGILENNSCVAQCGRSMIEMLGVLAIIGVLSVGGIAGYSKAMEQFKINKLTQHIAIIVTNVRTLFMNQGNYGGLNNSTAKDMGIYPDDGKISYSYFLNPFGGDSWLFSSDYKDVGDDKSFIFSTWMLPKKACVDLATKDWGSESSSGLIGVAIGFGNISSSGDNYPLPVKCTGEGMTTTTSSGSDAYYACSGKLPISPAKAAQYCSCGENNGCFILFKYK